ncbi:MAG: hypothetical protein AB8B83_03900 [Bdellovibrionales bacterium]
MSGMYERRDGDIIYGAPPTQLFNEQQTQSPRLVLSGVYKAEARDPAVDYCAVGRFPDGRFVCIPERYLRAALPEAAMGGLISVKQHPKIGGKPEQQVINLDLARIKTVLEFIGTKAPHDRPFGPRPGGMD